MFDLMVVAVEALVVGLCVFILAVLAIALVSLVRGKR